MATTTYVPIETYTLGSAASSVTFGSGGTIPQTYTDLVVVIAGINSSGGSDACVLQLGNGSIDTGSNYSTTFLYGTGSAAASSKQSNAGYIQAARSNSANQTVSILNVQNYSNTSTYKTVLSRSSDASAFAWSAVGLWRSTSAVNTLKIYNDGGGNFAAGSTFTLYGIANAQIEAPKATGGVITYDDTYFYHTFGASGTFTPTQNLTCDYLVVAGGGGGNGDNPGGGGGAGGLRSTVGATGGGGSLESAVALTSGTAYTITVGAGGVSGGIGVQTNGGNSSIAGSGLTTITSTGGGRGGAVSATSSERNGGNGGSGGGAASYSAYGNGTGGTGTANQGYAGGDASASGGAFVAAGGGGAGAVGQSASGADILANGGNGVSIPEIANITGTGIATYYAGGGGGGRYPSTTSAGTGGLGGGGNGGTSVTASAGKVNTGGGGGGGYYSTGAANGGSGIVIVRYAK